MRSIDLKPGDIVKVLMQRAPRFCVDGLNEEVFSPWRAEAWSCTIVAVDGESVTVMMPDQQTLSVLRREQIISVVPRETFGAPQR